MTMTFTITVLPLQLLKFVFALGITYFGISIASNFISRRYQNWKLNRAQG